MIKESELRIVSLISGGGSTMERIIKETQEGLLQGKVKVAAVIADRSEAGGIQKALKKGVRTFVIDRKEFPSYKIRGRAVRQICKDVGADVILQNGWISYTSEEVIQEFPGRIFNQHSGPTDPENKDIAGVPLDFGGKGMHGEAVHEAVLLFQQKSGRNFPTEATIHQVTSDYDQGGVVYRAEVEVCEEDTAEILAARVLPVEHNAQIDFLSQLYERRVEIIKRERPLVRKGEETILYWAKEEAIEKYKRKK